MIKVRENVRLPPAQGAAELLQLRQALGHLRADLGDQLLHRPPPNLGLWLPVRIHHPLLNTPHQLHRLMLRHFEQLFNTLLLILRDQR